MDTDQNIACKHHAEARSTLAKAGFWPLGEIKIDLNIYSLIYHVEQRFEFTGIKEQS
jgi:hypothetical protein